MNAQSFRHWRLALTVVAGSLVIAAATAAEPARRTTTAPTAGVPGLIQFTNSQAIEYSAVILPAAPVADVAAVPHDHVIIIDTSASQSGNFRTRSMAVAAEVCRLLPADDRVRLIATDVTTEELTSDFLSAHSKELLASLDRLEDRVPLGSSNVELALRTALSKFNGDRARSILYIGDGFSTAQLIQTPALRELVTELRNAAVPVNSLAIGPRTDLILLGSLAQHTGGVVVVDESNLVADTAPRGSDLAQVAGQLAKAAVAPILYPSRLTTDPVADGVLPQMLPPVRFDRETVLLAKDLTADKVQVKIEG